MVQDAIRDDVVLSGDLLVVHAVNDGQVCITRRRGDQHFLGTSFQMRAGFLLGREDAGAFHHHVNAQGRPMAGLPGCVQRRT